MEFSVVILLSMLSFADAFDYSKRCLLFDKKCVASCPPTMHAYHTRCDGETRSQRTCTNPSTYVIGYTCGWSRCDCNGDMLLDEESGFCVSRYDCPVPLPRRAMRRKRRKKRPWRLPKRVRVDHLKDPFEEQLRG